MQKLMGLVRRCVEDYKMIQEGDRIAVCISGGKDSMLMAKLFQELQRHRKISFDLVVDTMYQTGIDLSHIYRETSEGGLAKLYRHQ